MLVTRNRASTRSPGSRCIDITSRRILTGVESAGLAFSYASPDPNTPGPGRDPADPVVEVADVPTELGTVDGGTALTAVSVTPELRVSARPSWSALPQAATSAAAPAKPRATPAIQEPPHPDLLVMAPGRGRSPIVRRAGGAESFVCPRVSRPPAAWPPKCDRQPSRREGGPGPHLT